MPVQAVHTCRWATPTLFLPWPLWFDASNNEWSCTRGDTARGLHDPSNCAVCKGWTAASRPLHADQDDHLGAISA
jgi:hypothetical protein